MDINILIFIASGFIIGYLSRCILQNYPEVELRVTLKFPMFEIVNMAMYYLVYQRYGLTIDACVYALLCSLVLWISVIDLHNCIIPDEAVIAGLILGLFFYLIKIFTGGNNYWNPISAMLLGPIFYLIIGEISYLIMKQEAIGGGDIKLMAPIGFILGVRLDIAVIILSTILAGIISSLLLITKKKHRHDAIPFGPFISIATIIIVLYGENILIWYATNFL